MHVWRVSAVVCLVLGGCGRSVSVPEAQTIPIKGTVTLDNKPLAGANVVFLLSDPPAAFVGTTKEDGTYELQGRQDLVERFRGECKVTVSQMVKPDGSPLAPGELPAMVQAAEVLPARYSRLESTELSATVAPEGGTFDFKLTSK
ncbi:MAG TPA: hypothetical protein VHC19_19670 [Pirellulales bacterium]|nr:hypothetical protein [Pirellulales bacterium]